jgi:hypothetical protein
MRMEGILASCSAGNPTPYGALLPAIAMLEKLGFRSLVERTVTSKRIPRAMDLYRFVLGLYIGFPRLNQLRFIARDPILTGILRVGKLPVQSSFWRFLNALHRNVVRQILTMMRTMRGTTVHTLYGQQMGGRGVPLEALRVPGVDVQILLRAAILPPGALDRPEHRAVQILFLAGLCFHPGDHREQCSHTFSTIAQARAPYGARFGEHPPRGWRHPRRSVRCGVGEVRPEHSGGNDLGLVSNQPLQSSESARTYEIILPSARRRPEKSAKALPAADERGSTRINESCFLFFIGVYLSSSAASIGSAIS